MEKKIIVCLIASLLLACSAHCEETLYDFKLGSHDIRNNNIKFEFPSPTMKTLYLFNLKSWEGIGSERVRLVVNLYDEKRALITSGKSVYITKPPFTSFGSIAFSGVTRETIGNIAYFSVSVEAE